MTDSHALLSEAVRLHERGRLDEARRLYRRVLKSEPGEPDALHLLGLVEHQRGHHDKAVRRIREAIAARGDEPLFHYNLALALRAKGDADGARQSLQAALALDPENPEAIAALANFHLETGDIEAARPMYERAVALNPDQPRIVNNHGTVCRLRGDLPQALACFERAVTLDPELSEGWANLISLLQELAEPAEAVERLQTLVDRSPGSPRGQQALGRVLERADRVDEAITRYERALAMRPDDVEILLSMGAALIASQRVREAVVPLNRATDVAPEDPRGLYLLGAAVNQLGFMPVAEKLYRRALEHEPAFWSAATALGWLLIGRGQYTEAQTWLSAALEHQPDHPPALAGQAAVFDRLGQPDLAWSMLEETRAKHPNEPSVLRVLATVSDGRRDPSVVIELLKSALTDVRPGSPEESGLRFSLASMMDKQGEADLAFEHALRANALKPIRFDRDGNADMVRRLTAVFDPGRTDRLPRSPIGDPTPIFVVGLPRSGTTLVEQILASHPDVHGAGERSDMNDLTVSLSELVGVSLAYPEVLLEMTNEQVAEIGATYIRQVRAAAPPGVNRVADKMPMNHWHVGFITRALPGARVVHCTRDLRDVGLSQFFHDFQGYHRYAYDLESIGQYARDYVRMMNHWATFPGVQMLDLSYEALVAEPERVVRELLAFVGLPFDQACLRFHETERVVTSASYRQVRRPMYTSSVGRWRRYEAQLVPLIAALQGAVKETP